MTKAVTSVTLDGRRPVGEDGTSVPPVLTQERAVQIEPLYVKLPGGRRGAHGLSKDEVAADQRRRLRGAMIDAVDRHGYHKTTAREVCQLAGVSERAFYELFIKKEGCFL